MSYKEREGEKEGMYIGNHLSSSSGFEKMGEEALRLGASTFAFFTRNPVGGAAKEIDPEDALRLRRLMEEHHFGKLVAHAPYTLNVCAEKENVKKFSREVLADDLNRMEYLPGNYYNFHRFPRRTGYGSGDSHDCGRDQLCADTRA